MRCDRNQERRWCFWGLGFFLLIRMAGKIAGHLLRSSAKKNKAAVGILNSSNDNTDMHRKQQVSEIPRRKRGGVV